MKSIKEVQEKLHQEIENYILFLKLQQERSAGLAREKEMSVADVDVEGLSAADKAQVVREFVRSGTMKSFFGQKYTAERFSGLESELADILNRSVKRDEKQHKHSEVIWLRENEMARETYADYMLRGEDYTLFAKAGLHQRSYRLWTEGDNYMKVYYEHLKDLRLNSFLPHNDRRFSTIHSSYLSQHPEMYKYLILRQKAWFNLLNSCHSRESSPMEAVMAFAYVFSRKTGEASVPVPVILPGITLSSGEAAGEMQVPNCGQEDNQIYFLLDKTADGLRLKLVIRLSLQKEEFAALVKLHDPSAIVNTGFTIHAEYGKECYLTDQPQTVAGKPVEEAFTFFKIKECIRENKQGLTDTMRTNPALVTSDMDNGQFLQLFTDMCTHKMNLYRTRCTDSIDMLEQLHQVLGPKIEKLRKDVVNLEIADLRQEIQTMAMMQDELTKWHKEVAARIGELSRQEEAAEKMKTRDL